MSYHRLLKTVYPDRRPRWQFSLKQFLILFSVVSVVLSLLAVRGYRSYQRNQTIAIVENAGGVWSVDYRQMAVRGPKIDDKFVIELAPRLSWVPELRVVGVVETAVTDDGLFALSQCSTLSKIYMFKSAVTAAGIAKANKVRPDLEVKEAEPDPIATRIAMSPIYRNAVVALAFTPDGQSLLAGTGTGRLLKLSLTGATVRRNVAAHKDWLFDLAVSPNGKLLATGGGDNQIRLWNARTLMPIAVVNAHAEDVHAVQWLSDERLVSAGDDCTVRDWLVVTRAGKLSLQANGDQSYAHNGTIPRLCITPNRKHVLTASRDNSIGVWSTGATLVDDGELIGHRDDVMDLAISPDSRRAISVGYDGALCDWDLTTRKNTSRIDLSGSRLYAVCVDWKSHRAIIGGEEGLIHLDIRTGKVLSRHADQPIVSRIRLSPDATHLATASADGRIILRTTDLRPLQEIQLYDEALEAFDDDRFHAAVH